MTCVMRYCGGKILTQFHCYISITTYHTVYNIKNNNNNRTDNDDCNKSIQHCNIFMVGLVVEGKKNIKKHFLFVCESPAGFSERYRPLDQDLHYNSSKVQ